MLKKLFFCLSILGILFFFGCSGDNIVETNSEEIPTPHPVGPVSQYGQLLAGHPDGLGRIYGACKGVKSGEEVQLRGMSLYWSILPRATDFYTETAITTMVRDMKVQLIRLAISTQENWGGDISGYILDPEAQLALIDQAVHGAVLNDIYVIIDWHSHMANWQLAEATEFFEKVSAKYGKLDNVIFEVFNEPMQQSWDDVKSYADSIVKVIRKNSDNLILVGTPNWDQKPHVAIDNEVEDFLHNIAYTFHFYANTHRLGSEGSKALQAMRAGLSVFVSEWGTGNADGGGTPGEMANANWQRFLDENLLSSANWSASKINEGTAAFLEESDENHLVYSTSGQMVKDILSANPDSYTACKSK